MSSAVAELPYLDEVPEISDADQQCFEELRQVLVKRGCEKRFGLNLLHRHFSVDDDEIMLENNDPATRTLTMSPVKKSEVPTLQARPTSWRLDSGRVEMNCICPTVNNAHAGSHVRVGG